ncbi:UNVERIFIED_CONTAM: hypothetical protein Sindi_0148900, partial [Sesamum indicum]
CAEMVELPVLLMVDMYSLKRMAERDLKELGIPMVTGAYGLFIEIIGRECPEKV